MMNAAAAVAKAMAGTRSLGVVAEQSIQTDISLARREARVVATAIDLTLLAIVAAVFAALGGLTVLLQTDWLAVDPSRTELVWGGVVAGLWLAVPPLYFTVGSWRGGTAGSRRVGIETRRYGGTAPLGGDLALGRAASRAVLLCASFPLLGIGLLVGVFHPEGRALHDLATRTAMVERSAVASGSSGAGKGGA
jgi:uncharacterized RDD family membrane protein YckC